MRYYIALLLLVLVSCTKPKIESPSFILPRDRVEELKLPHDPASMPLAEGIPTEEWILPLESGECIAVDGTTSAVTPCPELSGILFSEASAMKFGMYKLSYRELRVLYENDRNVWKAHRSGYEDVIRQQQKAIIDLQPTFLQKNALTIGFISGVLLTSTTTALILSATR